MISEAYDKKYTQEDMDRMMKGVMELWNVLFQAGGNPAGIASFNDLKTMTVYELLDTMTRNGIHFTFKK